MEVASSDWFNFGSQMSAEVWVKPLPGDIYWRPIFAKLPTNIVPSGSQNRLFSIGTEARGAVWAPRHGRFGHHGRLVCPGLGLV